ncbi:LysR family transcriptional regulator [Marinomonas sp. CT5]|uniref:LysR family transcriptional regulator n=1 Tax=Marinomonas sp. CT5 TaxID=2066133 RepID=UPI0017ED1613|nr:LysR family transcriptional regulator [Marinomonas sp. CT5]NVK72308.1 LysR family transcriptional regulator [Oceanospirillaceae bacterium]QUX94898.1 LysR family transcriptional regulator [Marinomonas sp. CT5]
MSEIRLSDIDLNLLYVFHILIEELNVTKAATRLNVSQPAVSRSLSRLREVFDDPLFIRTSHGLSATAKTLSLASQLSDTLTGLESLIQPCEFDPKTSKRRFILSTTDFGSLTILHKILDQFRQEAPNAILEVKSWHEDMASELDQTNVDVAVAVLSKEPPTGIRAMRLKTDCMVCLARKGHVDIDQTLTLEGYLTASHVQVVLGRREYFAVDRELDKMGHKRHVAVHLPNFVPAARVMRESNLLLTAPRLFAEHIIETESGIEIHELPFKTRDFDYSMMWHERFQRDAAHVWFRRLLSQAFLDSAE